MADVAVFKPAWSWGAFVAPCVITERGSHTWDVTEHAVEDGGQITDHVTEKPVAVDIALVLVDTPGDGTDAVGLAATTTQRLLALAQSRTPATIVTGVIVYPLMVATSIQWQRDSSGRNIPVMISFRQVRTITAQTARVPPDAPSSATVPKKVQAKTVKPEPADAATVETGTQSWAASGFDTFADFFGG